MQLQSHILQILATIEELVSARQDKLPDNNRLSGTVISLLGGLSIVAHIPPLFKVGPPVALALTVVLPSVLGLVLIGVGYATARGRLIEAEDAMRVAGWVVVGMLVFLLVGVWILVLDLLLGQSVPFGFLLTVNTVTLGGVVGVVIGLYDAQNRKHSRTLKQRERELVQRNQRLDEFASIVSHDLRNPLNVATGRLELAQAEHDSEHLDVIEQSHARMETLIDDVLQLARQGEPVDEVEDVDLADLTHCWQTIDTANADLRVETDGVVKADQRRLQQLLENLMRNAVEHGGEDVTVTIGDLDEGSGFYVADDGPGIPADKRDEVFEKGYSGTPNGTGFGLSIVKEIADAHGWTIRATNSNDGGARFEITGVELVR